MSAIAEPRDQGNSGHAAYSGLSDLPCRGRVDGTFHADDRERSVYVLHRIRPTWHTHRQACLLYLAAARRRAVIGPVMRTIRRRELERLLARVGAGVFVTVDRWGGFDHADLARSIAPDLPDLRTLVVLGQTQSDTEVDFGEFFVDIPWEQRHPVALNDAEKDPDAVSIVLSRGAPQGNPRESWAHRTRGTYRPRPVPTPSEGVPS